MNCQQVDEYVFSYCDGELASPLASELESHIAHCNNCRAKIELTRLENDIIKNEMFSPLLSDAFTASVISAINKKPLTGPSEIAATQSRRAWYTRTPFWLVATAAAFILLVYTVSPGLFMQNTKIATQKSKVLKVAEKNVATNATFGGNASNIKEKSAQDEAVPDEQLKMALPADIPMDATDNHARTLVGSSPDQVNGEIMMKREFSPDRDRTDGTFLKAAGSSATMPKVTNMPSSFKMLSSSKQDDGWTFLFEGSGKQITVSLTSAPSTTPRAMTVSPESGNQPSTECVGSACKLDANTKSAAINSVVRSVKVVDAEYNMTVTGQLSVEELNSLAGQLNIEK